MKLDHPLTREGTECPICFGPKDQGLVACWPCYRKHLKYGGKAGEKMLDDFERLLVRDQHRDPEAERWYYDSLAERDER
jgi:hypothetical protein